MTKAFTCDHCETLLDDLCMIHVTYPVAYDDDDDEGWDDDPYADAHFCGYECLTSWAMNEALTHPD